MTEIANGVTADITSASKDFNSKFRELAEELADNLKENVDEKEVDELVSKYVKQKEFQDAIKELEKEYGISKDQLEKVYSGALKGLLIAYFNAENGVNKIKEAPREEIENSIKEVEKTVKEKIDTIDKDKLKEYIDIYTDTATMQKTAETMARDMIESLMRRYVLSKVGELSKTLGETMGNAFNVDPQKIASAFTMNMSEEQLTRIMSAMLSKTKTNAKTNLITFGYQDKEEPTYIAFYFKSFDGKENFKEFIASYNDKVKENGHEDKVINYTDTTGILMESVKIIVNAVTYVLIAFISISLVVSSIMIGIITYISVYERTKEIGILRAIGASKRNISSIFNAETFIIGLLSGLFGIGITYALIPIINAILHHFTGNIPLNATFYPANAVVLVILSIILTLIGGLIPARAASKKDPVVALRTE